MRNLRRISLCGLIVDLQAHCKPICSSANASIPGYHTDILDSARQRELYPGKEPLKLSDPDFKGVYEAFTLKQKKTKEETAQACAAMLLQQEKNVGKKTFRVRVLGRLGLAKKTSFSVVKKPNIV